MSVCETCRDELHPESELGIVYAVELELIQTPHGIEYLEGGGVFFHLSCFPSVGSLAKGADAGRERGARRLVVAGRAAG